MEQITTNLTDNMEGFHIKKTNYREYEISFRRWLVSEIKFRDMDINFLLPEIKFKDMVRILPAFVFSSIKNACSLGYYV